MQRPIAFPLLVALFALFAAVDAPAQDRVKPGKWRVND
jgi:hypothetical protein